MEIRRTKRVQDNVLGYRSTLPTECGPYFEEINIDGRELTRMRCIQMFTACKRSTEPFRGPKLVRCFARYYYDSKWWFFAFDANEHVHIISYSNPPIYFLIEIGRFIRTVPFKEHEPDN
uniref:Tudor domain-containing protein n=1 Tax=Rhabditophanes sp. KR3021 TaxID=114890 RepID=A0AC35TUS0_9BILA